MPNPETALIAKAVARIRKAADHYKPVAIVGLISGGHDSATANLIAHEAGATMSLHVNTGIGVEETRDYVRETCAARNWDLREYKAVENVQADGTPDPQVYEDIVRKHGFPGGGQHAAMYSLLKERQLRRFEREIGATSNQPVLYVSGARSDESTRRMGNTQEVTKIGRQVWVAPILDFTKTECGRCMAHCGVKRSPVVDLIHKSGECLCGAFAEPGELAELKVWFPHVAQRIYDLQEEVRARLPWGWEDNGPPQWFREAQAGQGFMFEYDTHQGEQQLCRRCNLNAKVDAGPTAPPARPVIATPVIPDETLPLL